MKTALLYPYQKRFFTGCNPPVSLLYLAASLIRAEEEVKVFDIDEDNRSEKELVQQLKYYQPDVIGIPLYTLTLSAAYRFVQLLKSELSHSRILIGGPHATIRSQEVMEQFVDCDFILRGESENSIVDLIKSLQDEKSLDEIKGLSYRKNCNIVHNPDAELNMDLDQIRFPERDLLESAYSKNTYWRIGHKGTTDVIITSRGCPYNCNFCFRMSKKFRTRSPENIVQELINIRSRGIRNIHIMDDLFVWNKPRFIKIIDLIKESKLDLELKIRARVNFIDEDMLKLMKEVGVRSVVYGIESGSQKILDAMNKRTTVEMNYKAIQLTKKVGLQCYADIFIGYPGETRETIKETEKLILKARPTGINMAVMYPLPGTEVYNEAKSQGTLMNDWDIHGSFAWIKLPWIENVMDLYKIRKRLMRKYLRQPLVFINSVRVLLFKIDFKQLKIIINYIFKFKEL